MCAAKTARVDRSPRCRGRIGLASGYLVLQGMAGVAWWVGLACWPSLRSHFLPAGAPDWPLLSFWLADLCLLVAGSWACAVCLYRRSQAAAPALWFTSGAVGYACLYCLGTSLLTGEVWLATGLMCPAALCTLGITVCIQRKDVP